MWMMIGRCEGWVFADDGSEEKVVNRVPLTVLIRAVAVSGGVRGRHYVLLRHAAFVRP